MIIPLGHRLLVKPQKIEEVDKNYAAAVKLGLVIPDEAARKEQIAVDIGVVVDMGKTAFKDFGGDPWCNIGDKVAYTRYGGKLMKDPDTSEEYIVLNDEDVIAKYS